MFIKQLSVFVENKSGRLAEITALIAAAGVDLRAVSIADTVDFGILRLIVDPPDRAAAALRDAGFTVSLTRVIAANVEDKPGGFAVAMKAIADEGLDIEYMYAFNSRVNGRASVILRVKNDEAALHALERAGVQVLSAEELL